MWTKYEEIFSSPVVAELDAILINPQYENARDQLLSKLFETVLACVIAARGKENRLKTVKATDTRKKATKIIIEEAEKIYREHPDWLDHPTRMVSRVAREAEKPVNEKLAELRAAAMLARNSIKGLAVLSRRAIEARLERHYQQHDRMFV